MNCGSNSAAVLIPIRFARLARSEVWVRVLSPFFKVKAPITHDSFYSSSFISLCLRSRKMRECKALGEKSGLRTGKRDVATFRNAKWRLSALSIFFLSSEKIEGAWEGHLEDKTWQNLPNITEETNCEGQSERGLLKSHRAVAASAAANDTNMYAKSIPLIKAALTIFTFLSGRRGERENIFSSLLGIQPNAGMRYARSSFISWALGHSQFSPWTAKKT